jgi:hypothetical protein
MDSSITATGRSAAVTDPPAGPAGSGVVWSTGIGGLLSKPNVHVRTSIAAQLSGVNAILDQPATARKP